MSNDQSPAFELRAMPSEEAYYWFSKFRSRRNGLHAQRALRILLAGEVEAR